MNTGAAAKLSQLQKTRRGTRNALEQYAFQSMRKLGYWWHRVDWCHISEYD